MFLSGPRTSSVVKVPTILMFGQSNNDSNGQSERIANADWNYKGILANWPNTRTSQPQYVANPPGIHIYNRSAAQSSNWMADTGVWQNYTAGVNSRNVTNGTNNVMFGAECFLGQCIQDVTGGQVAIIKPSFAGIGLLPTSLNTPPGPWNYITRNIAIQVYLQRAVRDYAAFNPGHVLDPKMVLWWLGETEVSFGTSTAAYQAAWLEQHPIMQNAIRSLFPISRDPAWCLVQLDYYRNAAEANINAALVNCAAAVGGYSIDAHIGKSLQKQELTPAQALPLPKGTPNGSGNDDNAHSNYIALELISEQSRNYMVSGGYI